MHHHIRHLADIQKLFTHRGEEAYATFLDFEKAYDRVNWTYMFSVLEKMGALDDQRKYISIEPLGNLLRQHEEHGIWINGTTVATGLFFAADSTLLSETANGVLTQLDLVQVYCDGSGAKLNLNKSSLLSLNRMLPCLGYRI
uniref:AlNc14C411G11458 protein n=1 Tax=Albugo laibachii Nc14 TaxID=890382 RepID=F0WZ50_9STRA|nr:AlNc14C411G11458 [Albugo laibachii Nc14]|eukprot:CCA26765.1 AlNc14C411G11458 [Albugo laibachii Nc14]